MCIFISNHSIRCIFLCTMFDPLLIVQNFDPWIMLQRSMYSFSYLSKENWICILCIKPLSFHSKEVLPACKNIECRVQLFWFCCGVWWSCHIFPCKATLNIFTALLSFCDNIFHVFSKYVKSLSWRYVSYWDYGAFMKLISFIEIMEPLEMKLISKLLFYLVSKRSSSANERLFPLFPYLTKGIMLEKIVTINTTFYRFATTLMQ